jgi:hypothetical protein
MVAFFRSWLPGSFTTTPEMAAFFLSDTFLSCANEEAVKIKHSTTVERIFIAETSGV